MIVNFIASKGNITTEIDYYRAVVQAVEKRGHTLARDWIEPAFSERKNDVSKDTGNGQADWSAIDSDNTAAISKADVVIVEATKKSFFVGYGVAQAVHQKKPILILVRDDSFPGAEHLRASSDFIRSKTYTKETLDGIVGDFLEENTIDTKDMRFNFFIDRGIYNYLRWASFKTGKTKAEVLRELVQREIDTQDK